MENDPLDMRLITDDPIEGLYRSNCKPFVIDIPLCRLRALGSLAFPCVPGSGHPLIDTAGSYLEGRCAQYDGSPLQEFSANWKVSNAAEAMGLLGTSLSAQLQTAPAMFAVLPWSALTIAEFSRRETRRIRQENRHHGADLGVEHGGLAHGQSNEKGRLEFDRLKRVVDSIRRDGYCRGREPEGDVCGYLLIHGADWALSVRGGGQHRVAALAALGWSHAPVRIGTPSDKWKPGGVRRAEFASWPNVRSGLFTAKQALALFDRIFEGRQPAGCPTGSPAAAPR